MFEYSDDQIAQIRALRDASEFAAAYRLAAELAEGGDGVDPAVLAWLRGAAEVNEGVGAQSEFIRAYTRGQFIARFGRDTNENGESVDTLLQNASDQIARNVLTRIIDLKLAPTLTTIGEFDAGAAGDVLFNGDQAGWSGNPLFLFLGDNRPLIANILETPGDTYDALAMIHLLGSTGDWQTNIANAWSTAKADFFGRFPVVVDGAFKVEGFLESAYGGIGTSIQALSNSVVLGTISGDDTLAGTSGSDFVHGGGGDDILMGTTGNDVLDGGAGIDTVDYSDVNESRTFSIKTNDQAKAGFVAGVFGGSVFGDDISSLFGIERIVGTSSDDMFQIQQIADSLVEISGGQDANAGDLLTAVFIQNGGVTFDIPAGTFTSPDWTLKISDFERYQGTNQNDTFLGDETVKEYDAKGGNEDIADFSAATQGLTLDPTGGSSIKLKDVEEIIGTGFNDVINGSDGNETIDGGDDLVRDVLNGGGGDDILVARAGAGSNTTNGDVLNGGAGNDLLISLDGAATFTFGKGSGHDTIILSGTGDRIVFEGLNPDDISGFRAFNGRASQDRVGINTEYSLAYSGSDAVYSYVIVIESTGETLYIPRIRSFAKDEAFTFEFADGTVWQTGSSAFTSEDPTIRGNFQENFLGHVFGDRFLDIKSSVIDNSIIYDPEYTAAYDNYIDSVAAGTAPSILDNIPDITKEPFSAGATLPRWGGFFDPDIHDRIVTPFLNGGSSVVYLGPAHGTSVRDALEGPDPNATNQQGGVGDDVLDGGAGENVLRGGAGNDTLTGGLTGDFLDGEEGNDSLTGGGGNDILSGGDGADIMLGEAGVDTFYGGSGDDTSVGGVGDDWLFGDAGADVLDGGAGFDTAAYVLSSTAVAVTLVDGGTAGGGVASGGDAAGDTLIGIESVIGSKYNDTLIGDAAANTLLGRNGDDSLDGGAGNDVLDGGLGADTLTGGSGDDNVSGGDGDDLLIAGSGAGDDSYDGGDGIDTVTYVSTTLGVNVDLAAGTATGVEVDSDTIINVENVIGGTGGDVITGDANDNVLVGGAGNDTLRGEAGNDTLSGGAGDDSIDGGAGDDTVTYADTILGVAIDLATGAGVGAEIGNDAIVNVEQVIGGSGSDTLTGDNNDNFLEGREGADTIDGGLGSDWAVYRGSSAAVTIDLSIGNVSGGDATGDTLTSIENIVGSAYADTLTGDANDNFIDGGAGNDVIDGGAGMDTVSYASETFGVYIDLSAGTGFGAGNDTFANIENVVGGDGDDTIAGDSNANMLAGGAGDDTINGGAGADAIKGNDGDDVLIADTSIANDSYDGGADTGLAIDVDGEEEGQGFPGVFALLGDTISYASTAQGVSVDLTVGTGTGSEIGADTILNIETVIGGSGDDVITGDSEANILYGGAGTDTLSGGGGSDSLAGGLGDDIFIIDNVEAEIVEFNNEGIDTAHSSVDYTLSDNVENLTLAGSALLGIGNALDNVITGNAGDNSLTGGVGNDAIDGGAGADIAVYVGKFDDYSITVNAGDFTATVTDNAPTIAGDEGVDALINVEKLQFSDVTYNLFTNNAPIVTANAVTTLEDAAVNILASTLLANARELDGNTLSLVGVSSAVNGTVVLDGNGDVVFTPTADFNGAASFDYTVSDGSGGTTTGTVAVTVNALNDTPIAVSDIAATSEDAPITILASSLLSNDTDIDGDTLTVTAVSNAVGGTVALNGSGDVVFTPTANFNGAASFDYSVSDGNGGTATGAVAVTVSAVNDAPVVMAPVVFGTAEDVGIVITEVELLANASDVENDTLAVRNPVAWAGTLVDNGDRTWTLTPPADFNGVVDLSYQVFDGTDATSTTGQITVTPVNDAPVVGNVNLGAIDEDTTITFAAAELLANSNDPDGDVLSITSVSVDAAIGVIADNGNDTWTFVPVANFNGTGLEIGFSVSDGSEVTAGVAQIDVTAVNDSPVAVNDGGFSTDEDQALTITAAGLLANDTDPEADPLSVASVENAVNGSVAFDSAGDIVFTPTTGFSGAASFSYSISDGNGGTATAEVSLEVVANPSGPDINGTLGSDILFGTFEAETINGLAGNDFIVSGDGNDKVNAGSGHDIAFGGSGNDLINGDEGSDALFGGSGDDRLFGGSQSDVLSGGSGADHLSGDEGDDVIFGEAGDDELEGGAGNDALYGGSGNDTFVFKPGFGRDLVLDFAAGAGTDDVIEMSGVAGVANFDDLIALASQVNSNVEIALDAEDSIVIQDTLLSDLHEDDFRFVA